MSYLVGRVGGIEDDVAAALKAEAGRAIQTGANVLSAQLGVQQPQQQPQQPQPQPQPQQQPPSMATSGMPSIAGIPLPVLLIGGAAAAFFLTRK